MNTQVQALQGTSQTSDRALGTTIRSRYRLDALLGRGAMGSVYRAWDDDRQLACAVKLLQVDSAVREAALIRFRDEARMAAQIFHPHVVEILDHGVELDGSPFLVMELLRGRDLDAFLKSEVRLTIEQTIEIVTQIGSALHAVHQVGIVHRDIKPRNIFLIDRPGYVSGVQVKVIDFGLAKHVLSPPGGRGSDGMLIGTPEYLPPESWRGISAEVDARADQWALAVLTFRLITGRLPFESHLNTVLLGREILGGVPRSIHSFAQDVPSHVAAAISRAMSKNKEDRFASIHDFVRALTNLPLTTNSMNTAGTEFLLKPTPVQNPIETQVLPRGEPTKLLQSPVTEVAKVVVHSPGKPPPMPWLSQTCLIPAPESTTTEAVRVGGSADLPPLFRPAGRLLLAGLIGGLLTSLAYSGVHSLRANDRVRESQPREAKASTYVGSALLGTGTVSDRACPMPATPQGPGIEGKAPKQRIGMESTAPTRPNRRISAGHATKPREPNATSVGIGIDDQDRWGRDFPLEPHGK